MMKSSKKCLKATKALTERLARSPTYSIEQAIEEIREFYQFDVDKLTDQELRRIVGRCARKVMTDNYSRGAYILTKRGIIVNLNVCKDEQLLDEVRELMKKQIVGYRVNYHGVLKRIEVLTGQITIDDLFKDLEEENRTKEA